jgi:hypothetical protein
MLVFLATLGTKVQEALSEAILEKNKLKEKVLGSTAGGEALDEQVQDSELIPQYCEIEKESKKEGEKKANK